MKRSLSSNGWQVRLTFIASCLAYALLLQWACLHVVARIWGYIAIFDFIEPPLESWIPYTIVGFIPAVWMPVRFRRPSQWLYQYLYLAVYIPVSFVPLFGSAWAGVDPDDIAPWLVTLLLCMGLLGLIYRLPLLELKPPRLPWPVVWQLVVLLLLASYVALYFAYGSTMNLVGWDQVWDQRALAREVNTNGDVPIAQVIGGFMGSSANNANANLWADRYASLGLAGMLIVTLVAAGVFYLLDAAAVGLDLRFAVLGIAMQGPYMADVPIFTTFLGGGLGLSILLIFLARVAELARHVNEERLDYLKQWRTSAALAPATTGRSNASR